MPTTPETIQESLLLWDGLPWKLSLLLKSMYFLEALGAATWGRFGTLYYNDHGMTPFQIGLLEGCMTLVVPIVSMPLWGVLSDRFGIRKQIYVGTKLLSTLCLLALALPVVYNSPRWIFVVSVTTKFFVAQGVLDAYTLELLLAQQRSSTNDDDNDDANYYGRYRLYASASWGLGAVLMGWSTDHYGFELNFVYYALLSILSLVLIVKYIPEQSASSRQRRRPVNPSVDEELQEPLLSNEQAETEEEENESPSIWSLLVLLFGQPRSLVYACQVVILGAAVATSERLLFLYLVDDLKASNLLCGYSVFVSILLEITLFQYADTLVAWWGLDGMQLVAMAGFVLRAGGYTLLTPSTVTWILALEVLHGITFACAWTVLQRVCQALIAQSNHVWATAIPTILQTLYAGIGVGIGSVVGGWAMQRYGSKDMYLGIGIIVLACLFGHALLCLIVRLRWGHHASLLDFGMNDNEGRPNPPPVPDVVIDNHDNETIEPLILSDPTDGTSTTPLFPEEASAAFATSANSVPERQWQMDNSSTALKEDSLARLDSDTCMDEKKVDDSNRFQSPLTSSPERRKTRKHIPASSSPTAGTRVSKIVFPVSRESEKGPPSSPRPSRSNIKAKEDLRAADRASDTSTRPLSPGKDDHVHPSQIPHYLQATSASKGKSRRRTKRDKTT